MRSSLAIGVLAAISLFAFALSAQAATTEMRGYAWSPNIGWLSANCIDGGTCGASNYKLDITYTPGVSGTKTISGYMWSDTIGWVKFGGLSSVPSGTANATVATNGAVTGWARACAGTSGGTCASMTNATDSGGWDGWISFNCSNHGGCGSSNYATTLANGAVSGYAWGSDVIGWVEMGGLSYTRPFTPDTTYACSSDLTQSVAIDEWGVQTSTTCSTGQACSETSHACSVPPPPTGALTITPLRVRTGTTATVSWNVSGADSCTVTGSNGDSWSGISNAGVSTAALTAETVYKLSCTPPGVGMTAALVDEETVKITPAVEER